MKHIQTTMFKTIVFTIVFLLSLTVTAQEYLPIIIDGIRYKLNSSNKTASVIRKQEENSIASDKYYSGYIKIPTEIVYNNVSYTITSIDAKAFASCSDLTAVKIPESVTSIGVGAFSNSRNLALVVIPNSITSINESTFYGCSGLTSLTIPNSVTSINQNAFYGCSGLTSLTLPDNITSISKGTFSGCSSLTSIIIPNKVKTIEPEAFLGCRDMESITIGNGVTTISSDAFSECSSLTSITIPQNVRYISDSFKKCIRLKSVNIEGALTFPSNPKAVFSQCPIETLYIGENISIKQELSSPFEGMKTLKSVTFGDKVTSIGIVAFRECSNLSSVIIGNGVNSIGRLAFDGCSGLTSVHIHDLAAWCNIDFESNPLSYAHHLYLNDEEIKDLVIPKGITEIKFAAFSGCSALTSVTIPVGVTKISDYAFHSCI